MRSNPIFNDTAWMQNHAGEFYWTCDMCGVLYPAQTKCSQCPPRGPGGKGVVGSGKADFADQCKKTTATKKESMLTNCNLMHPALGKHPKEKEKQLTNGTSKIPPMNGLMTKAPRMEVVALAGNSKPTKNNTKANRLSKSMELARPTKELLTKVCIQTHL